MTRRLLLSSLVTLLPLWVGEAHAQNIQDDLALFQAPPQAIPPQATLPQTPTQLTVHLKAAPLRLEGSAQAPSIREERDDLGSQGHGDVGRVGQPDVTRRLVDVLLPFDADPSSLSLTFSGFSAEVVGNVPNVRPIGPSSTTQPGTNAASPPDTEGIQLDAQGRDPAAYGAAPFPAEPVTVVSSGRLRQYRYVRLAYSPYQWDPSTGNIVENELDLQISWERATVNPAQARFSLSDPVILDDEILGRFINGAPALSWYLLGTAFRRIGTYDYVIIIPQANRAASTELSAFVTHKQGRGYSPIVISIEAIDAYYSGPELADRMRAFLMDKVDDWGIEHVLLVGDPDPYDSWVTGDAVGSVPMKMAWPRGDGLKSRSGGSDACPTDHYFGDLSDDWDVDGDGYDAAWDDDYTTESYHVDTGSHDYTLYYRRYGIDFDMEARVGRIPSDDVGEIDTVLLRTMNYEDADLSTAGDRDRVYLGMSEWKSTSDNSYLGRQIHTDHLTGKGLRVVTLYEPGAHYARDVDMKDEALIDEWSARGAGMVIWAGHGSSTSSTIRYDGTDLMRVSAVSGLDLSPRSFVFQGSCQNGRPEVIGNLAHTLLIGGAMATIAGSRNSWFDDTQRAFGTASTIDDIGYWVARNYALQYRAGYAIKHMRTMIDPWDAAKWMQNALTFNLYGDPTVAWEWE